MVIQHLTAKNVDEVIDNSPILLIDFWADYCQPCKAFDKILAKVVPDYPDISFAKVNIEHEKALAESFQIRSIPFTVILKAGIAIYMESGTLPESTLRELLDQAKSADVSSIQQAIADDQSD